MGKKSKSENKSYKKAANDTKSKKSALYETLVSQSLEDLETLSANLAKAASTSSVLLQMANEFAPTLPEAKTPNLDPLGIAPYSAEVAARISSDPENLLKSQQELWLGFTKIWQDALGGNDKNKSEQASNTKIDKRFCAPEWNEDPYFKTIYQSYLLMSNWMKDLVNNVDGIDDLARRKTSFVTEQIANAFSPANFLLTNPVAIKAMIDTKGESLNLGMKNFVNDFTKSHGRFSPSQTDMEAFEVGKSLATTPGKVVYRGELFELIQYSPTTKNQFEIPLLFFPPWINKYYILDMRPDNSMVKWMTDKGHTVFVVSWVNPTKEYKDFGFEEYMQKGIFEALDAVCLTDKIEKVNCVGYCIGGTLLASSMAYMAHTGDTRINSATFFASQQDFSDAGDLKIFTDDAAFEYIKNQIEESGGVLSSQIMAETFNYLRSNDLVWSQYVNNYLLGKSPKPFDLLFWNSDQTRMPQKLHLFYLDNFYRKNNMAKGQMELLGVPLNLNDVKTPIYMQSSKEDHIAPFRSIFRGAKLFGGDVRMILAGSGHIAGVINHPDANKYNHWLPNKLLAEYESLEDWQADLTENPGSWWNDWNDWLSALSGKKITARTPGSGDLAVICDAPGEYVLIK